MHEKAVIAKSKIIINMHKVPEHPQLRSFQSYSGTFSGVAPQSFRHSRTWDCS